MYTKNVLTLRKQKQGCDGCSSALQIVFTIQARKLLACDHSKIRLIVASPVRMYVPSMLLYFVSADRLLTDVMCVAPPSKIRAHRHSHINNQHGCPLDSSTIRVLFPLASTPTAGLLSVILLTSIFDYSLADVTDGFVLRRDILSANFAFVLLCKCPLDQSSPRSTGLLAV